MELQELRSFLVIAESRSFSRASLQLNLAQPTVSRHIKCLETQFKAPLFYRHGRGVTLTGLGEQLYSSTKPLLEQLSTIEDNLVTQSAEPTGHIGFGVPPSIGATIISPVVTGFRSRCPSATMRVLEAFSGRLVEIIERGDIDIAVLYDARRSNKMVSTPLFMEDLYLICRPSAESRPSIEVDHICWENLTLMSSGHGLRRVIDAACKTLGKSIKGTIEIDSVAALKQLVEKEGAQTILPYGAVFGEVAAGRLAAARINSPLMRAKLVLVTAVHRPVTKALAILIELVRDEISKCSAAGVLRGDLLLPGKKHTKSAAAT